MNVKGKGFEWLRKYVLRFRKEKEIYSTHALKLGLERLEKPQTAKLQFESIQLKTSPSRQAEHCVGFGEPTLTAL